MLSEQAKEVPGDQRDLRALARALIELALQLVGDEKRVEETGEDKAA